MRRTSLAALTILFFALGSALGAALTAVKGYAAPDTGHAYARARELWERLGSPSEVPSNSIWAIPLPLWPRRVRFGRALGREFAKPKPSAERYSRTRSGSPVLWSKSKACRKVGSIPSAARRARAGTPLARGNGFPAPRRSARATAAGHSAAGYRGPRPAPARA